MVVAAFAARAQHSPGAPTFPIFVLHHPEHGVWSSCLSLLVQVGCGFRQQPTGRIATKGKGQSLLTEGCLSGSEDPPSHSAQVSPQAAGRLDPTPELSRWPCANCVHSAPWWTEQQRQPPAARGPSPAFLHLREQVFPGHLEGGQHGPAPGPPGTALLRPQSGLREAVQDPAYIPRSQGISHTPVP